jgi:hypothetical protein
MQVEGVQVVWLQPQGLQVSCDCHSAAAAGSPTLVPLEAVMQQLLHCHLTRPPVHVGMIRLVVLALQLLSLTLLQLHTLTSMLRQVQTPFTNPPM